MTIYSLDVLLFLFGTSFLFHIQFWLLLPDLHTGFSRGRSGGLVFPSLSGTRDQIANTRWIIEKAREFQKKTSISALLTMPNPLTVDHNKLWKILKEMTNLDSILKSRDITLSTRSVYSKLCFLFSSSHVWMWELDHKENWAPKNLCFWTVVLQKPLESPLNCKEIKPVNPKGN